ncbi:DUF4326 domain-containing protein [Aeromonas phage vB_AspA_Tola]|nr:DUF4326 domain-containing protein [Aeromonas phage vB_AspA_Tola]
MCKVVNLKSAAYDVYIGRAKAGEPYNLWCNPFPITTLVSREQSIAKFAEYFYKLREAGVVTDGMLLSLSDKRLGCFCKPNKCHGDVIRKAVIELESSLQGF